MVVDMGETDMHLALVMKGLRFPSCFHLSGALE